MAKRFWAVQFEDGSFIHENPDYELGRTRQLQRTNDLDKAKLWQKPGMLQTYMKKNGRFAPAIWDSVLVEVQREVVIG